MKSQPTTGVSDSALKNALACCFRTAAPDGPSISSFERSSIASGSTFVIELLDVNFEDGSRASVVFKNLSSDAVLVEARHVKPAFLSDPLREIEVYARILDSTQFGTARFYGSVTDPSNDRYWLFLEWIDGVELFQIGDLSVWKEVSRWLARWHSYSRSLIQTVQIGHLLTYDTRFFMRWMERAEKFQCSGPQAASDHARQFVSRLARRYGDVVGRLMELPKALVHGDAFASNMLVSEVNGRRRICPVDWELCGIGPAFLDIAALTSGGWSDDEKRTLALCYRKELLALGESVLREDQFLEAIEWCRLHLCVQFLGWSPGWTPPPQHAHDWLVEAESVAHKLDL